MLSLAVKQKMKGCKKEKPQVKWTGITWCLQERQPSSAPNNPVFLLHIGRSVRYNQLLLTTPWESSHTPSFALLLNWQVYPPSYSRAPEKHELDGPLAHSYVLEEGHPHFPPPRAIKVHFLQCKGSKNVFSWNLTPIMNRGSRI